MKVKAPRRPKIKFDGIGVTLGFKTANGRTVEIDLDVGPNGKLSIGSTDNVKAGTVHPVAVETAKRLLASDEQHAKVGEYIAAKLPTAKTARDRTRLMQDAAIMVGGDDEATHMLAHRIASMANTLLIYAKAETK